MNPQSTVPQSGQQPPVWGSPNTPMRRPVNYGSSPTYARIRLIIVIVTLVVAAVIVLGVFTLAANKREAADTERKTDILTLERGLKSYAQEYDVYPSFAQISNRAYTKQYMADVPNSAFEDPRGKTIVGSGSEGYLYSPSPAGCDNKETYCTAYRLEATLNNGSVLTREAHLD